MVTPAQDYRIQLQQQTVMLSELIKQNQLCQDQVWSVGIELEGWFFDKQLQPVNQAHHMIKAFEPEHFSQEVIQPVFEINTNP